MARRQGVDARKLSGTVQNDILKEYIARGTYIYPPRASMRIVTDLFAWAGRELPEWNTISISGYHIREAGSTAVQEVAFTFANAIAYIEAALAAGLAIDDFAPRLSFFFNAHSNFLEEIAKFRAARRLYAHLMRDRFGARRIPKSMMLRFHVQTAGSTLTAQQPDVNVIRTTIEALSAVLGGAQSLHTNSRDEALSLPTEESARLALRTQQIIAYESGVTNTADPVGGSEYIERLTAAIERGAKDYLERIAHLGGTLQAIESGFIQSEIQNAAFEFQKSVERGETVVVGSTGSAWRKGGRFPLFGSIQPSSEHKSNGCGNCAPAATAKLVAEHLQGLEQAARGQENLMPLILDAAGCLRYAGRNLRPSQVRVRRVSRSGVRRCHHVMPGPRLPLAQTQLIKQATDVIAVVVHAELGSR